MNESQDSQYQRVQETLLGGIRDRQWGPGDRLPSRSVLAAQLKVSPATVAAVMKRLTYSGVVVGPKGGAKCVTEEPMRTDALNLFDTAADIRRRNRAAGLISPD